MQTRLVPFVTLALLAVVTGCGDGLTCPVTAPASGSSCSHLGLACETGGGDHQRCSTVSTCQDSLDPKNPLSDAWSVDAPSMCMSTNDTSCPADYNSAPVAMACPTAGVSCDYPEGRCTCAACNPTGVNWRCRAWDDGLADGCPSERPALGTKCKLDSGVVCRYDDACAVSFGGDQYCQNGIWTPHAGLATPCAMPVCGIND